MKDLEGIKLEPLFYSEITSSCILEDTLKSNKDITRDFVEKHLNVKVEKYINVSRERKYIRKGSIDLFISLLLVNNWSKR